MSDGNDSNVARSGLISTGTHAFGSNDSIKVWLTVTLHEAMAEDGLWP